MFEQSLVGLEARKKSRPGWFSLPVAILIHLVVLGTFAFASYWNIDEVPDPPINIVFPPTEPPPPPPPLGSRQQQRAQETRPPEVTPPVQEQTVQPEEPPEQFPPTIENVLGSAMQSVGVPDGHPEGVTDGVPDGVPHSTGERTSPISSLIGTGEPPPANSVPILKVGGAVKKPEPIYQPQPRYTELARRAKVEGVVILKAVIDERGNVTDLQVLQTQPMGLEKAALDAVRTWRFKPATLHGQPVKVYFTLTVNFQLS